MAVHRDGLSTRPGHRSVRTARGHFLWTDTSGDVTADERFDPDAISGANNDFSFTIEYEIELIINEVQTETVVVTIG